MPDLNLTVSIFEANLINVQWTFANLPEGYRKPFKVPEDIIR
jgi:hypothetical protein